MRGNQKNKNYTIKWTPEFAYTIGLITTDGCLSSDGRHLDFTSKDVQLLNTFKECLNLDVKIGYKTSSYTGKQYPHVQFSNVRLYKYLLEIGLMPNKTKKLGALKIPDKYFFDFLRGHLDGDGCIRKYQDPVYPNSQKLYIQFISASLEHLKWLQKRIKYLLNIHGYMKDEGKRSRIYVLTYAKKESLILLSQLYYNNKVPCLKRKYKIIQPLLLK